MIRFNSLVFKLPALVLVTVSAALALSGYLIDQRLLSYHRQTATALMEEGAQRIQDIIWQTESELFAEAQRLLQHEQLQATLTLINDFQDSEEYQPFVFDPEKRLVAEQLLNTVQNGTSSAAFLFDNHNALVSYALVAQGRTEAGFLSYVDGAPKLRHYASTGDASRLHYPGDITSWRPQNVLGERYRFVGDRLFLTKSYRNFEWQNSLGTLVIARELSQAMLQSALPSGVHAYLFHPQQNAFMVEGEKRLVTPREASSQWQHDDAGFWRPFTPASPEADGFEVMLHYPAAQYRIEQRATRDGVIAAVLITALLVLPISFWLVRRFMVVPLVQLMRGVNRISRGDKEPIVVAAQNSELGQLANAVNAMSDKLQQREQRISRYAKEMERLSQVMAHHFQEPSRRLVLFSRQLQNASLPREEDRQAVVFIRAQATRLSALVDGARRYLEISRTSPRLAPVDLNQALKAVLADPKIHAQITQWQADIRTADLPVVQADSAHIHALFTILVDNALCYRHAERLIMLRLWSEEDAGQYRVYVQDNGVGIAPEHHHRVFSLFERLVTDSQGYPGVGLGLSMARQIMRQLGGRIAIHTSSPEGTTFVLVFYKDIKDESSA
ncbi:sensor histidine kinase [Vreelandella massiliensis]|uniref:sensor histidine kinase n=1 Tax=Vreelandella massiliensis TaxID=1816686 RepID=UPI00096A2DE5|nr:HAMP domain-containing sensor histidine kinase [Halomonas massiliensis]